MAPHGQRSTAGACPQFQTARELRIVGKREVDAWRAGPSDGEVAVTGAAGGDAATWWRWMAAACPQKQSAREINIAGVRAEATWLAGPGYG